MLISRNYKAEDWEALTFKSEADWETAVVSWLSLKWRGDAFR
jgi:hypothetical protein